MKPEIFRIPFLDWPVHGYGLMIVIGFLLASWLATREARRRGLPEIVYDLGVWMLLSGLLGGRLFHYIQFYEDFYAGAPWYRFFYIWEGGLVFQGGALGGAAGGLLFLLIKRAPVVDLLDTVAPFVPIGMGFGRLGCFMNGCCYGTRCSADFPLGVSFPMGENGRHPGAYERQLSEGLIPESADYALPVYPVQIFEAVQDFVLCGILWWLMRRPFPRGGGIPLLFALYGLIRFGMEFLRGDNEPVFLGMTVYQTVSVLYVLAFGAVFGYCWVRGRRAGPLPESRG